MAGLDMDDAAALLDWSLAPVDIITMILKTTCFKYRFTCALVCKAWAKAAAEATRNVGVLLPSLEKSKCFQQWLEKHGNQLDALRLHGSSVEAALTALPCAQLQNLDLYGDCQHGSCIHVGSRVWSDMASATKLTSVALSCIDTTSQQADVVSALTALPDLEQFTWQDVQCSGEQQLSDSLLLQHLTKLTALDLQGVSAAALEHLGALTRLQKLIVNDSEGWAAAGCQGLQRLTALTGLQLWDRTEELWDDLEDIPASVCQLSALQWLDVWKATPTTLYKVAALTGLTQLCVRRLEGVVFDAPLQLPGLQHLVLHGERVTVPMSFLASCTELRVVELLPAVKGLTSLVASTMLEHLALDGYSVLADQDRFGFARGPVSWQQVFLGLGQLPHLTSLQLSRVWPRLEQADVECVVACCTSLQVLYLQELHVSFAPTLVQLSGLTKLYVEGVSGSFDASPDEQCGALAQLTGLRELTVGCWPNGASAAGLQQLAALEQLTSLGFVYNPDSLEQMISLGWAKPLSTMALTPTKANIVHGV